MQPSTYKILQIASIIFLASTSLSCKDFFEQDLSDKTISIVVPQNNTSTAIRNVHFKWKELESADNYTIEVVSPSFANIHYFNVDSTFANNEIFLNLVPGIYQWRVRGNNNSSNTEFSIPFSFTISSTSDLTGQVVVLNSPRNANISNSLDPISFNWSSVSQADDYDFILKDGNDFSSGTTIQSNYDLTNTSVSASGLGEKTYVWGVRAKNNIPSLTNYSTRVFYIDTTHPLPPSSLGIPADNATFSTGDTVNFTWNKATDPGGNYKSAVTHIVIISTDPLFSDALTYTIRSTGSKAFEIFTTTQTYYWKMYSVDGANNESKNETARRKFIVL